MQQEIQDNIDALQLRIDALEERRVKEQLHAGVLRELLDRLDPPPPVQLDKVYDKVEAVPEFEQLPVYETKAA